MQYLTPIAQLFTDRQISTSSKSEAKHQIEQNRVEKWTSFFNKKRCLNKNGADLVQRNRQNASKHQGTHPSHLIFYKIQVVHCFS